MTITMFEEALAAIRSGSGDIADALNRAAQLISGIDPNRKGTVVVSDTLHNAGPSTTAVFPSVLAADTADYLVVISATLVAVIDLDAEGVECEPFEDFGSVGCANIAFAQVPTSNVDIHPELAEYQLRVLMAAVLIRNARAAYQLSRDYVRDREQFGAPLVKIPGVAMNLARVHVELQRLDAAFARGAKADASLTDALVLSGVTADAATRVARLTHQLHGAWGIRGDYPLQTHTRRIWAARDFPSGEYVDTERVGKIARLGGESVVWDLLTTAR